MSVLHMDSTLEPMEEVRVRCKMREVISKLKGKTHFSKQELDALLIIYYKLTKYRPMDRRRFREVMHQMFNIQSEILMDRIFSAFDITNSLRVTAESWAIGMSIYLRGTLSEKIKFCFQVYDMIGDGLIKKELMFLSMKNCLISRPQEDDSEETVRELVDLLLKKMDQDRDGNISFADYEASVVKNPGLLEVLGQCLPSRPNIYKFMATFTANPIIVTKQMEQQHL